MDPEMNSKALEMTSSSDVLLLFPPPSAFRPPPPPPAEPVTGLQQLVEPAAVVADNRTGGNPDDYKPCPKGHWKSHEDARLRELVAEYGPHSWNLIADKILGRSGKSCRLRWFNQLDPKIIKKPFTAEEEERLLAAHRTFGKKWAVIAKLFPGRTDNAVKNQWHVIMTRHNKPPKVISCARDRRRKLLSGPRNITISDTNNNVVVNNLVNNNESAASTLTDLSLSNSSPSSKFRPNNFQLINRFGHSSPIQHYQFLNTIPGPSSLEGVRGERCVGGPESPVSVANDTTTGAGSRAETKKGMVFFDFLGVGGAN